MNAISLESLGISKEDLTEKLLDRLVEEFTTEPVWDEDGNTSSRRSTMSAKIVAQIKEHLDATVRRLGDEHVLPRVTEMVEGLVLQTTNQWGEKTGKPVTFIEYLTQRAEAYMREDVDYQGKPKGTDSYSWTKKSNRLSFMIDAHLQHSINTAIGNALSDLNSNVAKGLAEATKAAIGETLSKLKVTTAIK